MSEAEADNSLAQETATRSLEMDFSRMDIVTDTVLWAGVGDWGLCRQ
jgi:hypothetical protein